MEQEEKDGGRKGENCRNQAVDASGASAAGSDRGHSCSGDDADVKRKGILERKDKMLRNKKGMEFVQVAILIALAVALGIIFRTQITEFVNNTFADLNS